MNPVYIFTIIREFIFNSLSVIIPLLLNERGVSLEVIGVVLSVAPFFYFILRTSFAFISDRVGHKIFFFFSSVATVLATFIYSIAGTPFMFGLGKFFGGGIADSTYWAVNRLALKSKDWERKNSILQAIVYLAGGAGYFIAGFLIDKIGFSQLLSVLFFLSFALFIPWYFIKDTKEKSKKWGKIEIPTIGYVLAIAYFANTMAWSFAIPIYLRKLNYGFTDIGAILAMSVILTGISAFTLGKKCDKRMFLKFAAFEIPSMFLLSFRELVVPAIIIWSIAYGGFLVLIECIVAEEAKKSDTPSSSVSMTFFPTNITKFVAMFLAGFIAAFAGLANVFVLCAFIFAIFIALISKKRI